MASLTFVLDKQLKSDMEHFSWVNWSEVNREELNKKRISEKYMRFHKLSPEDQKFCDKIDWHPVDELPLREEFIKELKKAREEPSGKAMTIDEFNKWCEEL